MKEQKLLIKYIEEVTHDVLRFTLKKSNAINFIPGQAAEITVDKDGWREKGHPFTFTSLPSDDFFEFTIKIYPDHNGVTDELSKLSKGDFVIIKSVFGAIKYKGKGTFIAGGAGVTPFISIIRDLNHKQIINGNRLIFANKKEIDIINCDEFKSILGKNFVNILSREEVNSYSYGYIDTEYLKEHITQLDDYFYICGPPPMMKNVEKSLLELGVNEEKIVKEVF